MKICFTRYSATEIIFIYRMLVKHTRNFWNWYPDIPRLDYVLSRLSFVIHKMSILVYQSGYWFGIDSAEADIDFFQISICIYARKSQVSEAASIDWRIIVTQSVVLKVCNTPYRITVTKGNGTTWTIFISYAKVFSWKLDKTDLYIKNFVIGPIVISSALWIILIAVLNHSLFLYVKPTIAQFVPHFNR